MELVDTIEMAMLNLGGDALYEDLYREIGRIRGHGLTENQEGHVRYVIQKHSEDSQMNPNRKRTPLFYSVGGLGSGHWGLIRMRGAKSEGSRSVDTPEGTAAAPLY